MSVSITWTTEGQTLIGSVSGRVDSNTARHFHESIESEAKASDKDLRLDFSQLSFISSAGLRILLLVARKYDESGRLFCVSDVPDSVRELFEISGFDRIIRIYDPEEESDAQSDQPTSETAPDTKQEDPVSFQKAFNLSVFDETVNDICDFAIEKHESITGSPVPPEHHARVKSEIMEGLGEVSDEIKKMLRESKKSLFHAADVKLKEILQR